MTGGGPSDADRLILEAATGARQLTEDELQSVLQHVAQAGFSPLRDVLATGLSGLTWQGHVLAGRDRLTAAEYHYLRHVVVHREWPDGTQLPAYLSSIRRTILDPRSGLLLSRYHGQWQFTIVRRSGVFRGPAGFDWILVDYRIGLGHWVTAFQPRDGLGVLRSPRRESLQWLRPAQ
jgi:hypothetical protein